MKEAGRILGLIPARGGSKRVPGKNLQDVGGRSLLARTIEQANQSCFITRVIVSSDDEVILAHARSAGAEVMRRPTELAQDDTPGIAPVIHALETLEETFSHIVLLQPTSPFRTAEDIDKAIGRCLEKDAPACVTVRPVCENPAWMFTLDDGGAMTPLLHRAIPARSQDLPSCYILNGAVYVAKRQTILEQGGFLVHGTIASIMPTERSLDIDTLEDLEVARRVAKRGNTKKEAQ